ncbi:MAG: hypothetical protein ACJA07_000447 [Rhodococcus sp. (in: high G+C Gram-positive bacteria)]
MLCIVVPFVRALPTFEVGESAGGVCECSDRVLARFTDKGDVGNPIDCVSSLFEEGRQNAAGFVGCGQVLGASIWYGSCGRIDRGEPDAHNGAGLGGGEVESSVSRSRDVSVREMFFHRGFLSRGLDVRDAPTPV